MERARQALRVVLLGWPSDLVHGRERTRIRGRSHRGDPFFVTASLQERRIKHRSDHQSAASQTPIAQRSPGPVFGNDP
jgi:hypothetical protein